MVGMREVQLEKQNPERKKYTDKDSRCNSRLEEE